MAYTEFPHQKKSLAAKNTTWRKDCINGAEGLAIFRDEALRKSIKTKIVNYNLYSDILDDDDVKQIIDPLGLDNTYTPAKMQNYPIINPKVDLLWGEEVKRSFDWRVRTINEDAISEKEKQLNNELAAIIVEEIKNKAFNEEDFQRRLKDFEEYRNYNYQDKREVTATWILKHLWEEQRMKIKLDKGFKDALLVGEEIYQWDIIGGQPVFLKHNPLNVHTVRNGESPYIEDAEIIVIDSYYPLGKVIDEYHEYLTDSQVAELEEKSRIRGTVRGSDHPDLMLDRTDMVEETIDTAVFESGFSYHASPFDTDGNLRVLKVYWKSLRKMLKVKYYDEFGDEQYELMPETYTIDKTKGEEAKAIWISEWWEGHKLGAGYDKDEGIYVKMQPRPIQFRRMENPSLCHPGIIGTIYNTNDNKSVSFYDRMKPYQYMYNALMYNTELAIATNWGKIMRMNLAEIPDGWEVDKWISYAKFLKIAPTDPFKEGQKGAALGKIAGNLGSSGANPVIDMEQGNTIQLYIMMMEHIKQEVGEIVGVSRGREGQISPSSTSGNVQREIIQSSHTTEYYFAEHSDIKRRCLSIGLETAKLAWKNSKTKKLQFILDDMSNKIVTLDLEDIRMIDFDLHISNSKNDQELLDNLKQLAHAGIQNDKISFTQLMDIYTSSSITSIRRKIEKAEQDKMQRDQKAQEQAAQMQTEKLKAEADEKEKDRSHDITLESLKGQNAVTLEQIKAQLKSIDKGVDLDHDGIKDEVEIEKERIRASAEREKQDKELAHDAAEREKDRTNALKIANARKTKTS